MHRLTESRIVRITILTVATACVAVSCTKTIHGTPSAGPIPQGAGSTTENTYQSAPTTHYGDDLTASGSSGGGSRSSGEGSGGGGKNQGAIESVCSAFIPQVKKFLAATDALEDYLKNNPRGGAASVLSAHLYKVIGTLKDVQSASSKYLSADTGETFHTTLKDFLDALDHHLPVLQDLEHQTETGKLHFDDYNESMNKIVQTGKPCVRQCPEE